MIEDFERCYRAVESRDPRFDGWFITGVLTTGIYCRPSCPARTPKRTNARFFPSAAAAQEAGLRACKRCLPDATPGSPTWDLRGDLVARAMRLIADGIVDREGVDGLARRLGYSARHLNRQITAELGAGPLALARAQRAHTARTLVETTGLSFTEVAFAAGFSSLRQFNDTVRAVYAASPTELQRRAAARSARGVGRAEPGLVLRLPFRAPGDPASTLSFLSQRAVAGVEEGEGSHYRRTLRLPHGHGVVELCRAAEPDARYVQARLALEDLRDLGPAVQRCRRLLDLDADPVAVAAHLGPTAHLGDLVRQAPGRRVPGTVDGFETAVRTVLGQQISVAAARTLTSRLVAVHGKPLDRRISGLTHLFPDAATLAEADLSGLGVTQARAQTLHGLAAAVEDGRLVLDAGLDRATLDATLGELRGIGPWTVAAIRLRLGDPDAFPSSDAGVVTAVRRLGIAENPKSAQRAAEAWRPWRAYAAVHLWASLATGTASGPPPVSPAANAAIRKEPA